MRVLVYKRTHPGDPEDGVFGSEDCMGSIRKRDFDAVIGVGGLGRMSKHFDLAGKLHWIGIEPIKLPGTAKMRGPFVLFRYFVDYGTDGPMLQDIAPALAARFYNSRLRHMMDQFEAPEKTEIKQILRRAYRAHPSPALGEDDRPKVRLSCRLREKSDKC